MELELEIFQAETEGEINLQRHALKQGDPKRGRTACKADA